jgi:lipoprotein-anchoring transpeptidase ErfK/SrfK
LDEYRGNLPGQRFLFGVHYTLGLAQQAAGNLDGAEAEYQLARPLAEDVLAVDERLTEIAQLRIPPTPIPRQKRIEVSIAKQRLYAYEDDELVYDFVSSTGMYSSPTLPGTFEILDKIPMAYGSTWDLDMPYWMGIYWSGNLENGIHALPILANGQLLWEGYLGQPASYGCVILSTEDAETLYNWAEIGTPVIIY